MPTDSTTTLLEDLTWLRTLARRLARDPHLAEDLVQDACAIALSRRTPPNQWRAWLTTVMQNLLCTHRRREQARLRRGPEVRGQEPHEGHSLLQRAEAQQQLVAAVLQLEEPYRATVLLRFFEGLPPRRIASSQGVPVATVHSRLQRALQQLRARLDRDLGGRANWLAAFAPFAWSSLATPSFVGLLLMQTKLKAVVVAVVIASTAPLWWPSGAGHDAAAAATAGALADRSDGSSAAGRSSAGTTSPLRAERRPVVAEPSHATPEVQRFMARGRVCNCDGAAIADVLVAAEGASAVTARSDALGNFALELTARSASVTAAEDRFVTVLAGEWSSEATIAPVVVVANAVSLAGRVVDTQGTPVAASQLLLQLPDDFDSRFQVPLDRAGRGRWGANSSSEGAFALPRLPAVGGAVLLVTADAFAPQRVPLPPTDDDNLQIVMQRFHFVDGELLGRVVSPTGDPVAGARIAMGVTSVVSDREGCFGISLRRAGWPTAIVAAKAGYSPGRLEVPRSGGKQREDWPAQIVLRLGPEPQKVRGRVVDQDKRGLGGAEVWIHDPTLFGIAGMLPMQLEYLIAGGEVPAQAARIPVPFADDPTHDGNFTNQASPVREPTACWFFATADAEGNFELPGLLDRTYTLRALDPTSGLFGEVAGVTGGSFQQIEIQREVWPELRGRVVSRSGRPIADVRVEHAVVAWRSNARVPGGSYQGTAVRKGRETTTGPDGTFVLRDVGKRNCFVKFSGDPIVPTNIKADAIADPKDLTMIVQARCQVEVVLVDPSEADQVACRDAAGNMVDLAILRRNSSHFETELAIHNGRSGLFVVGEDAVRLVLLRNGDIVREIAIAPDPARTTTVQ
ncbi:MAG TPA: sigma-70 family RNA polymerase sigma factor [Planctomycetota bacterium]|nr:sigma-70 family RNA polymerase sigma factor [Planctomycetota bacterium]